MNKDKNEAYVETAEELGKVDVSKTDYLLGDMTGVGDMIKEG